MSKLLSIVIPTKERYQYLKECVTVLEEMALDDCEIVVQDNTCDNSDFLRFMEENPLRNTVYYHCNEQLSVTKNSDLAIQHATGEYVCFIGDDDCVCRQIMGLVRYMKYNQIDACSVACARYNWPDLIQSEDGLKSVMIYEGAIGNIEQIDGVNEMLRIMCSAVFSINRLPKVYQGIVRKKVLDEIYAISGSYSPGASPDIANAVAVCVSSKRHIYVNSPIIISGYSYKSGAGLGARKNHVNKIENVPWLDDNVKELWERMLPRIWTAETIWAESMLKGLKRMHKEEYLNKFNYVRFYAMFLLRHRDCFSYLLKVPGGTKWLGIGYFPFLVLQKVIKRCFRLDSAHRQIVLCEDSLCLKQAVEQVEKYIHTYPLSVEERASNAD